MAFGDLFLEDIAYREAKLAGRDTPVFPLWGATGASRAR
jgi:hypothetical protein